MVNKSRAEESEAKDGSERRRNPRRKLPFGRSAVLRIGERDHVVALVDVSRGGACVATRTPIPPDAPLTLKLLLPSQGVELRLPCELVRIIPHHYGRQPGIALRFSEVTSDALRRLDQFVESGLMKRGGVEVFAAPALVRQAG
jgi:hypothetical protein